MIRDAVMFYTGLRYFHLGILVRAAVQEDWNEKGSSISA